MVQFGLDHRVPSVRDERKRRIADADYYCRIDGDEREMLPVKRRSSTWLAPADPRTDRALFVSPNPRFGGDPTWRRIGRGRWWGGEHNGVIGAGGSLRRGTASSTWPPGSLLHVARLPETTPVDLARAFKSGVGLVAVVVVGCGGGVPVSHPSLYQPTINGDKIQTIS
jgi:hypothetical protein